MSMLPAVSQAEVSPANAWFEEHYAELLSRARLFARRMRRGRRDDAIAEIVAQIWKYTLNAASRGKLHLLTPYTLVSFFGRAFVNGRRLMGSNTVDALSPTTGQRHHVKVLSLDQPQRIRTRGGHEYLRLSEILCSRREPEPFEACRQDLDYPLVLRRQKASRKARRVFAILARSHGAERGVDIARRLRISPPRVVQLKHQLVRCLTAADYAPPAARRTAHTRPKRTYSWRRLPPLNPATNPTPHSRRHAGRSKRLATVRLARHR